MIEKGTEKVVKEHVDRWSFDYGDERVIVAEVVTKVGEKPTHVKVNGTWYTIEAVKALGKWLGAAF